MRKKRTIQLFIALLLTLVFPAASPATAQDIGETVFVVQMQGTGTLQKRQIPTFEHNGEVYMEADCFDLDLIDPSTGSVIGTAVDCLNAVGGDPETGLQIVGTSIFNLPDGTLVSRGLTSVQPTTHGSPEMTHITGALSDTEGDIVYGTHAYAGAVGTVRLSGTVNLSELASDGEITFSCIFVIALAGDYPNPVTNDGPVMVLQLLGTDTAETQSIPAFEHNGQMVTEADCFDTDLIDLTTGNVIGQATDCLNVVGGDPATGLQIVGTTEFNITEGDRTGRLVLRGLTSVQPTTHGSPNYTHITGAIPPVGSSNDILAGDGDFASATGSARLSGLVNLSKLESDGAITFNCIFIIQLTHKPIYALQLKGTDTAETCAIPPYEYNGQTIVEADCFDLDLIDVATGRVIGTAADCIHILGGDPMTGLQVLGTTIFNVTEGAVHGTFTSRGLTTVQPVTHGSPEITHITGAVPGQGSNDILSATGGFEGASGSARLSGAVNLSKLASDGEITFDCLFIVTFDQGSMAMASN